MVVAIDGASERYGWIIHLGPVIARLYGSGDVPGVMEELHPEEVLRAIFDVLHPLAAHRTLFWLECYTARYPDGRVDATCRLHNDDWQKGRDTLLVWASRWPAAPGRMISKRQFMVFEPAPVSELPS